MKLKTLYQTTVVLGVFLAACCGLALWRSTTGVASATTMNLHTFPEFFNWFADVGTYALDKSHETFLTIGVFAGIAFLLNRDFSKTSDPECVSKHR